VIRVLIVEDEPLIAEAHRQYTERVPGFVVHGTVGTGNGAVRIVASASATASPIDLVLLDIGLPDASGIEVASALGGIRPAPDIIAISSERDLAVVRSAVAHGIALDLVVGALREKPEGLNASEAAARLGISRVTAWRYLERLADDGAVVRATEYGKAGRPQVRYVLSR